VVERVCQLFIPGNHPVSHQHITTGWAEIQVQSAGLRAECENGLSGEIAYYYYGAVTYPLSPAFSNFTAFGVVTPNTRVGSYNLLNLRGAYKFWQQKTEAGYLREAEAAVSAFNALNDTHKEHPLGDTIGSLVIGWLTVRY